MSRPLPHRAGPRRAGPAAALVAPALFTTLVALGGLGPAAPARAFEVIDLSGPAPEERHPAPLPEPPLIKIEAGLSFSRNKGDTLTQHYAGDGAVEYRYRHNEIAGELRFNREVVQLDDGGRELSSEDYDGNVAWRTWLTDNPFYAFVSPRVRFNRFGFFRSSQSIRAGIGRRWETSPTNAFTLEAGPGVRRAEQQDGATVFEGLYAVSAKLDSALTPNLVFRFNLVDERSTRENYRTLTSSLRSKLTDRVWLKFEYSFRRAFALDSAPSRGESSFDAGLTYSF